MDKILMGKSKRDMKALILAGGKGTRLKPLTNTITKQLIPVANKPILFYAIDQVSEAGIGEIGIIISPETGGFVKEAVGDGSRWGCNITYILQPEPMGLAHAVKVARDSLVDSPFIMHLGDTLIEVSVAALVTRFRETNSDALIVLQQVSDPNILSKVGVVQLNGAGKIISIEEKPEVPEGKHALVGIYLFTPAIHEAISRIRPSWRSELEITDAIRELMKMGKRVESYILDGWWLDTGKKDDLLLANRVVLERFLKPDIRGKVNGKSSVSGRVEVREGSLVENSTIQGPVSIAEDCLIRDSYIGPFTSVGRGTIIESSSIEHSVILENCHTYKIGHLKDSVVGNEVEVMHDENKPGVLSLFMGDNARIAL